MVLALAVLRFLPQLDCGFGFGCVAVSGSGWTVILASVELRFLPRLGCGFGFGCAAVFCFGWTVVLASVTLRFLLRLYCGSCFGWTVTLLAPAEMNCDFKPWFRRRSFVHHFIICDSSLYTSHSVCTGSQALRKY